MFLPKNNTHMIITRATRFRGACALEAGLFNVSFLVYRCAVRARVSAAAAACCAATKQHRRVLRESCGSRSVISWIARIFNS